MQIRKNVSLKPLTSFGVEAIAHQLAPFHSAEELIELLRNEQISDTGIMVLGGGSNVLFRNDFAGTILLNRIKGIQVIRETEHEYIVRSGAGEVWHDLVIKSIEQGWAGLENLSLIPGNVGASPIQNIGAYGVEIKERFHSLEAVHIKDRSIRRFHAEECQFGYRDSIFKREMKGQYIITSVDYHLLKKPQFNTSYGAIEVELERMGIEELSIRAISQAVINIRQSKLPDPSVIGNAGSFFKNPVVPQDVFESLKTNFPDIPGYPIPGDKVKLAAGWLIDQAGWKGKDLGGYGVHDRQALVLVNRGKGTGEDIYRLSEDIMTDVYNRYGIQLEREVNVI